jgi:hypothetical protein
MSARYEGDPAKGRQGAGWFIQRMHSVAGLAPVSCLGWLAMGLAARSSAGAFDCGRRCTFAGIWLLLLSGPAFGSRVQLSLEGAGF